MNNPKADIEGQRCGIQGCRGVWERVPGTERTHPMYGMGAVKVVCTVCHYDGVAIWTITREGE